jgi:hypothetical protein
MSENKKKNRAIGPIKEDLKMRIIQWLLASLFAASFGTVATAQEIDWQKVDDDVWQKARRVK